MRHEDIVLNWALDAGRSRRICTYSIHGVCLYVKAGRGCYTHRLL